MAGGPHAAIAPCFTCAGPADRVYEGVEDDHYRCRDCGEQFGICFDHGPLPDKPMWPISEQEAAAIRAFAAESGRTRD